MGIKTPGGEWVFRDADLHRCQKPVCDYKTKTGDRWKCSGCNQIWRVTNISRKGDQRETWYDVSWEKCEYPRSSGSRTDYVDPSR